MTDTQTDTHKSSDTFVAVVKRPTVALCVAGSIPARDKYLYGLQVVVPGLVVCACDFFMFVTAPTVQELYTGQVTKKKIKKSFAFLFGRTEL